MMRSAKNRFLAVVLAAFSTIGCVVMHPQAAGGWPDDARVVEFFKAHRSDFEALRQMSDKDIRIWQITHSNAQIDGGNGVSPRVPTQEEFPDARRAAYQALFKSLDLPRGLLRQDGELLLATFVKQVGSDDSIEKGIVYASPDLAEATGELSIEAIRLKKPNAIYKRIEGGWYVYARYNE
jgi:hypothetical protein